MDWIGLKLWKVLEYLLILRINQITYSGKYQDGKKVEIWEIKSKNIKMYESLIFI